MEVPDTASIALAAAALTTLEDDPQASYGFLSEEGLAAAGEEEEAASEFLEAARVLQLCPDLILAAHAQLQAQTEAEQLAAEDGGEFVAEDDATILPNMASSIGNIEAGVRVLSTACVLVCNRCIVSLSSMPSAASVFSSDGRAVVGVWP